MARPLSDEKRQALLTAAADLVAGLGIGASTAKIAKAAGVSEGTLFIYFPTKDDLLNQLFVEIQTNLADALLAAFPKDGSARDRFRLIWERLVGWGLANPNQRKAMRQLNISDRISADTKQCSQTVLREARDVVDQCLAGHADPARTAFYVDAVLFQLTEIVIAAIVANRSEQQTISQAGFDLFWNGTAR